MRNITAFILGIITIITLSACSAGEPGSAPTAGLNTNMGYVEGDLMTQVVEFDSGVTCSVYADYKAGGVSCDWSAVEGVDISAVAPEIFESRVGGSWSLDLVQLNDGLCSTLRGYKFGGIDCYYPN